MATPVTVVALTPVTGGPFYGEVLAGIAGVLGAAGGRLVVVQTLDAGHRRDQVVSAPDVVTTVGWTELHGVISITTGAPRSYLERVRAAGKAVVMASGPVEGFAAPSASPDNSGGVSAAVAHLIGHGHRRIGFVGNLVQADVRERRAAYEQTLRAHGIDPSATWFFEAIDYGEAGGRGAARALIATGMPVTAVMVGTDRNAIALVEQLAAVGVSVPGDLAVVGVDGIERGSYTSPTLSTVRQDFAEVGRRLRTGLRDVDVASRFGGDEFALLLHDIEPSRVRTAVEGMQGTLQEPVELDGHAVTVTASVGIATGDAGYADADEVLRDADIAMYEAKATRRGSYRFFDQRWRDTSGDGPTDPAIAGSA